MPQISLPPAAVHTLHPAHLRLQVMGGVASCAALPTTSATYSGLSLDLGGEAVPVGPAVPEPNPQADECGGYSQLDICGTTVTATGPADPAKVQQPVDRC